MTIKIEFKRLSTDAKVPSKATEGACGYDLVATDFFIKERYVEYDTDLAVAIPKGYVGLVYPRSSVSKTGWHLANSVGVVDQDYRGPIKLRFYRGTNSQPVPYEVEERVGQLVIVPCPTVEFTEVDELDETDRGEGGFGSTGK